MASALGLIRVVSNDDLDREEERQRAAEQAWEDNNTELLQGIARQVMEAWELARDAKQKVLPRLLRAQRARQGRYEPDKLAAIRSFGGSEEYARITANKCRVVEAWLRDVFQGQTTKPWTLQHTPDPDFPPGTREEVEAIVAMNVAQQFAGTGQMPDPYALRGQRAALMEQAHERLKEEARQATERMERVIEDQLVEGGFDEALADFIADFVVYPAAIMKGPVLRKRRKLSWEHLPDGAVSPQLTEAITPEFARVDPFRAYPAPGTVTPQEGFFIEHLTYTRDDLYELIGVPGFNEEAIRAVLQEADGGALSDWLGVPDDSHAGNNDVPLAHRRQVFEIECLEYHGPILGSDLLEWGMDKDEVDDPDRSYEACVWLIGKWVIKAQLNYDPLGVRPYHKTCYEELPGEFGGMSIPDILDDVQGIVNAAVRALSNNMGMASGPQVGVNIDRLAPGEDISNLEPWRIWQIIDAPLGAQGAALEFYQPASNARELMEIIEKFYQFADDFSLVPRYMAGSDRVGGAGRTASGLSMLMDAANKGLKGVVANIDQRVLAPLLQKLYSHNMIYHEDNTIKGDAQVVARGAISLMQLESLQLRRNEFLNITANPLDSEITGREGRAEVLREVARGLQLDTTRIVPPREVMEQQAAQRAAMPQGAAPGGMGSQEVLQNGAAVTDNFSPSGMVQP